MIQEIILPWPDMRLNPNNRSKNIFAHARIVKKERANVGWLLASQKIEKMNGPVDVTVTFRPPDERRRDDDNMIASFKTARDEIAKRIGVDDADWTVNYTFLEKIRFGQVTVVISTKSPNEIPLEGVVT